MTPRGDDAHVSRKALYSMYTSFPIRCVRWRSGYECELAVTSYQDATATTQPNQSMDFAASGLGLVSNSPKTGLLSHAVASEEEKEDHNLPLLANTGGGNPIEIWDVRRGYVAKWTVRGSAAEGGVTGRKKRFNRNFIAD
jgi:WD repeat-containing protein 24